MGKADSHTPPTRTRLPALDANTVQMRMRTQEMRANTAHPAHKPHLPALDVDARVARLARPAQVIVLHLRQDT